MAKGHSLLHAIVGPDSHLAERALEGILAQALGRDREGALQVLYGDETTWGRLAEIARTGSLFAPKRAIVVRGADGLKGDEDAFGGYLGDPSPDVTLVLMAAKPDKRRNAWKLYLARATVASAEPKRGAALRGYVADELKRRGLRLEPEGLEDLLERLGQDLRRLLGEVDKLEAFAEGRKNLTAEDVAAVQGRGMAKPLYMMSDAVAERDPARALALLETLLDDGEEPLRILSAVHRSLRQMRAVRSLQAARAPREEMLSLLPGNMAFKLPSLLEAARRWSEPEIRRGIVAVADQDRAIKTGGDARAALTAAIVGACRRAPAGGRGGEELRPRPWPRPGR
jgi:DNA polymerase-3 subunit delta